MTYDPIPYATPIGPGPIENSRRGALIAFGVISLLIGSMAGCFTIAGIAGFFMMASMPGAKPAVHASDVIIGLGTYVVAAALFIWVGIDSIRCKRWVRPVAITVGWISIVGTLFSIVAMLMMLGGSPKPISPVPTTVASTGFVVTATAVPTTPMLLITIAIMTVFGLIVPAAFVWFYSTAAVKQTLEAYSPVPSWTERCPLPVFGACAGLLLGAFSTVTTAVHQSVPFFGTYLEGLPAVGLILLSALVMLAATVLMFRSNILGWWLAFVVIALGFTSAIMTLAKLGMLEFYRRGHTTGPDIDELANFPALMGAMPIFMAGAMGVFCLGYLIWVYRYFDRTQKGEPR